jgi:NAD(P)H-dependent flavin oxidoreductase YrpB (nitropropane dioxygenase family)
VADGIVLHTGIPNPGIKAALRRFSPDWERVFGRQGLPVIVHLAATRPVEVRRAVELIERVDVVSGLELGLRDELSASEMTEVVHAARGNVPLIVRLPIDRAERYAPVAVKAGADALCVGAPPRWHPTAPSHDLPRSGRLYSVTTFEVTLAAVAAVTSLGLDTPLVAAGGIIDSERLAALLAAGAVAAQVDLTLWRGLPVGP